MAKRDMVYWKRLKLELEIWNKYLKLEEIKDLGLSVLKDKVGGEGGFNGVTAIKGDSTCVLKEVGAPCCLPGAVDVELSAEGTPDKPYVVTEDATPTKKARHRKQLDYQTIRCGDEKIATPTPEDGKPSVASVIDMIDSDNESDVHASYRPSSQNKNRVASPSILTPETKRKRDLKVVTTCLVMVSARTIY